MVCRGVGCEPGGPGLCPLRAWGRHVVGGWADGCLGRVGRVWLHLLRLLFDCVYVVVAVVACLALPALQSVFFWMEHWKMVANFRSATIWSSPIDTPQLLSCGCVNAVMRSFVAYRTASWDDTRGI